MLCVLWWWCGVGGGCYYMFGAPCLTLPLPPPLTPTRTDFDLQDNGSVGEGMGIPPHPRHTEFDRQDSGSVGEGMGIPHPTSTEFDRQDSGLVGEGMGIPPPTNTH